MKNARRQFRDWLIERLSRLRFGRTSEENVVAEAARLGILPATLEAARQRCARRIRVRHLRPPSGRKRHGSSNIHPQIKLWFPKAIWKKWQDWCELSGVTSSAGLRSVLHVYLQQSWEPPVLTRTWWYAGVGYPRPDMPEQHPTEWIEERALITSGALQALRRRAGAGNVTPPAVIRGLVYECLDRRIVNLIPIDARTMWDDPDKYWIPPGWTEP